MTILDYSHSKKSRKKWRRAGIVAVGVAMFYAGGYPILRFTGRIIHTQPYPGDDVEAGAVHSPAAVISAFRPAMWVEAKVWRTINQHAVYPSAY